MNCKYTNRNLTTHGGFQWVVGEWRETSGDGRLCGSGWLHRYEHPLLAELLNPIHGAYPSDAPLWEVEVGGESRTDGLKWGDTRQRLIRQIERPVITLDQRIRFAFRCADHACRVIAPTVLEAHGLTDEASRLRALSPVTDLQTVAQAQEAAAWVARTVCAAWAAGTASAARASAEAAGVALWVARDAAHHDASWWAARAAARAARATLTKPDYSFLLRFALEVCGEESL